MEVLTATTADGLDLALGRVRPTGPRRAVCLCAHAMMARSSYFRSAGFAERLAARGVDVFLLDFRGHGRSAADGPWTFDDLVRLDLPAAVDRVAQVAGVDPFEIVYLGHSLGGLVGLAGFGTGHAPLPGRIALWATSVWLEGPGGSRARRALMSALSLSARATGFSPIRRLRVGTDDEPYPYVAQLTRWVHTGRWTSLQGTDYGASLSRIRVPVWGAVGERDPLCRPSDADYLRRLLPGAGPLRRVGRRFGDALDPDHFTLFTRPELSPLWDEAAAWMAA